MALWATGVSGPIVRCIASQFFLLTVKILRFANNLLNSGFQWKDSHPNTIIPTPLGGTQFRERLQVGLRSINILQTMNSLFISGYGEGQNSGEHTEYPTLSIIVYTQSFTLMTHFSCIQYCFNGTPGILEL